MKAKVLAPGKFSFHLLFAIPSPLLGSRELVKLFLLSGNGVDKVVLANTHASTGYLQHTGFGYAQHIHVCNVYCWFG